MAKLNLVISEKNLLDAKRNLIIETLSPEMKTKVSCHDCKKKDYPVFMIRRKRGVYGGQQYYCTKCFHDYKKQGGPQHGTHLGR